MNLQGLAGSSSSEWMQIREEQLSKLARDYKLSRIKFRSALVFGIIFPPLWAFAFFHYFKMTDAEAKAKVLGAPYGWELDF